MPHCSLMSMGTSLFYFKIEVIVWQIFGGQSLNKNLLSLLFQRNYLKLTWQLSFKLSPQQAKLPSTYPGYTSYSLHKFWWERWLKMLWLLSSIYICFNLCISQSNKVIHVRSIWLSVQRKYKYLHHVMRVYRVLYLYFKHLSVLICSYSRKSSPTDLQFILLASIYNITNIFPWPSWAPEWSEYCEGNAHSKQIIFNYTRSKF